VQIFNILRPAALLPFAVLALGCHRSHFPDVPAGYREFAYVANGGSNTVSILDLVYMRPDRTLQTGIAPSALAVNPNPKRNEVYVVNSGTAAGNGSISVIDTTSNSIVATIPVHKLPTSIDVDAAGHLAYVANSGSNSVSVIDLDLRREVAVAGTGEQPTIVRISTDMRSLVIANRTSGSVSIFAVDPDRPQQALTLPGLKPKRSAADPLPRLRATFPGCPAPTDAVILPYSTKVFIACSGRNQVMAISLAAAPSRSATQDASLLTDHLLAMLDVGSQPAQLVLKPDGGEIFSINSGSGSFSEINTTNPIGTKPTFGIVDADNAMLWVSNSASDSLNLWSIDDAKNVGSVSTGNGPGPLAFSSDQHLLLAVDVQSGDVTAIRTVDKNGPNLFTILPAGRAPNAIVVKAMQGKP
jgi:YVTN family beta-propeller protein